MRILETTKYASMHALQRATDRFKEIRPDIIWPGLIQAAEAVYDDGQDHAVVIADFKKVEQTNDGSNGDWAVVVIRDGHAVTTMLRRSDKPELGMKAQPFLPGSLGVDQVHKYNDFLAALRKRYGTPSEPQKAPKAPAVPPAPQKSSWSLLEAFRGIVEG